MGVIETQGRAIASVSVTQIPGLAIFRNDRKRCRFPHNRIMYYNSFNDLVSLR